MDPSDIPDLPELAVELRADGTGCLTLPDGAHPIEDSDVRGCAQQAVGLATEYARDQLKRPVRLRAVDPYGVSVLGVTPDGAVVELERRHPRGSGPVSERSSRSSIGGRVAALGALAAVVIVLALIARGVDHQSPAPAHRSVASHRPLATQHDRFTTATPAPRRTLTTSGHHVKPPPAKPDRAREPVVRHKLAAHEPAPKPKTAGEKPAAAHHQATIRRGNPAPAPAPPPASAPVPVTPPPPSAAPITPPPPAPAATPPAATPPAPPAATPPADETPPPAAVPPPADPTPPPVESHPAAPAKPVPQPSSATSHSSSGSASRPSPSGSPNGGNGPPPLGSGSSSPNGGSGNGPPPL